MPRIYQKPQRKVHRANPRANLRRRSLLRDYHGPSPFVHGMAKVVDVGGILCETNTQVGRKAQERRLKWSKQPDLNVVEMSNVMGTVGTYFQRVIEPPVQRSAPMKATDG